MIILFMGRSFTSVVVFFEVEAGIRSIFQFVVKGDGLKHFVYVAWYFFLALNIKDVGNGDSCSGMSEK